MRSIQTVLAIFLIAVVAAEDVIPRPEGMNKVAAAPSRERRSRAGGLPSGGGFGGIPAYQPTTAGTVIRGDLVQPFVFHNAVIQEFRVYGAGVPRGSDRFDDGNDGGVPSGIDYGNKLLKRAVVEVQGGIEGGTEL